MASVDLAINGPIARLTLNHPERHNSLTEHTIGRFLEHLERIEEDKGVRVLIVTGAGEKTFCSGMSLDRIQSGVIDNDLFQSMTDRLAALPLPKIAAINGSAYGGGVEIGLCCDFRIGVTGMKALVPAAKFGLCYPPRGIQRYVRRLGVGPAKRFLVAAEKIKAPDLLRMGYLQQIVDYTELNAEADRLARYISKLAPMAVRAMLEMCDQAAAGSLDQEQAQEWVDRCNQSDDLQEGLQAAVDKRRPKFRGR